MTIAEVIPLIESLPLSDKFRLMQFLSAQISQEEKGYLQVSQENDSLWSITGMAEGEETDTARRHDEYLYGQMLIKNESCS